MENEKGEMCFDQIGVFQNISNDFDTFCQAVNIPNQKLAHENKSKWNIDKRDIFTQETIDMVAEKEKWVINKFDYDFDFY